MKYLLILFLALPLVAADAPEYDAHINDPVLLEKVRQLRTENDLTVRLIQLDAELNLQAKLNEANTLIGRLQTENGRLQTELAAATKERDAALKDTEAARGTTLEEVLEALSKLKTPNP